MADIKIGTGTAETPPKSFRAFHADVYARELLGPNPGTLGSGLPHEPENWLRDQSSREFFYNALVRLLWERGGTVEAAKSIRKDLEDGQLHTVIIDKWTGDEVPIEPKQWRASEASAWMYWAAEGSVWRGATKRIGYIYLVSEPPDIGSKNPRTKAPEPPLLDWSIKLGQSQKSWTTDPAVVREAERRVRAAGVAISEIATARAMEVMAQECGASWRATSIVSTRRKSR